VNIVFFFRASRIRRSRARLPRASGAPFVSTTNHHSSTSEVVLNPRATRVRRGGIGPRSRRDRLARRSRRRRRRRRERETRAKRRARSSTRSIVVVARARDDPRSIVDDPRSGGWLAREISRATSRDSRISPVLGDRPSHPHVRRTALIRARRARCVRGDAVAVARVDGYFFSLNRSTVIERRTRARERSRSFKDASARASFIRAVTLRRRIPTRVGARRRARESSRPVIRARDGDAISGGHDQARVLRRAPRRRRARVDGASSRQRSRTIDAPSGGCRDLCGTRTVVLGGTRPQYGD